MYGHWETTKTARGIKERAFSRNCSCNFKKILYDTTFKGQTLHLQGNHATECTFLETISLYISNHFFRQELCLYKRLGKEGYSTDNSFDHGIF